MLLSTSTEKHNRIKTCCSEMPSTETHVGIMHGGGLLLREDNAGWQHFRAQPRAAAGLSLDFFTYINQTMNKQFDSITQILKNSVTE